MTDAEPVTKGQDLKRSLADIDSALWSKAVYTSPDELGKFMKRDGTMSDGMALGELTARQTKYLRENFEVLNIRDFGKDHSWDRTIHAVTVRDKRTGEITFSFPGTNPTEVWDIARAVGIAWGSELDVYDQSEEYIRAMHEKYKQPIYRVVGHSAGASVAVEMGRRLDDTIIREVVGFQAPGTVRSTDQWGSEWGGNEPQFDDFVDGKRVRTYNADGDFIGNFGARAGQHGTGDVTKGGAKKGPLAPHSLENNLNTRVDKALDGLRDLGDDAEIERIEGLKFPSAESKLLPGPDPYAWMQDALRVLKPIDAVVPFFEEQKAGNFKEKRLLSEKEQKAARQGTLPQLRAGQAAGEQGQAAPATLPQSKDAVPGQQSRASGWDRQKMASLARRLEAGQGLSGLAAGPGAASKQAGARNLLYRPDGQDHRRTMAIGDLSELDRNTVQLLNSQGSSLGSFAELNQRRAAARDAAGQPRQDGFGFAGLKNGAATAGGKPAAPGKRVPFDQDAFLNTPLDRLDEAQVRHAMIQPAYYQSWRPFSREVNDHVTNWFRRTYPG